METLTVKACTKCGESKSFGEFCRRRASRDGHTSQCKACIADYRSANREHSAAYYAANREHRAAYMVEWQAANRKRRAEYAVEWRSSSEGQGSEWASSYRVRARMYGFDHVIEPFTRDDVLAAHGDACAHCDGPFEHLDHFPVPVALGGPHTLENVRPSCATCNTKQSSKIREQRLSA